VKAFDDPRIIYKELPKNEGLSYSLNYGIEQVKQMGEVKYIARMDSDDVSLPWRIET
jgi:glycosyltransferase involved in cell wall biosynthesis